MATSPMSEVIRRLRGAVLPRDGAGGFEAQQLDTLRLRLGLDLPGGVEATQLRVAEQYVKQFGEIAKAPGVS